MVYLLLVTSNRQLARHELAAPMFLVGQRRVEHIGLRWSHIVDNETTRGMRPLSRKSEKVQVVGEVMGGSLFCGLVSGSAANAYQI
jgi:hypothetical protein